MTDPEPLYLEADLWQRITETLRSAPDLPAFACLPKLADRIALATWDGMEGEMVQIEADPAAWDACLVALDLDDPPSDGKRTLGYWLMKQRACAARSRELAGKK